MELKTIATSQGKKEKPMTDYFGRCPFCLNHSEYMNVGSTHVMFCAEHKVYWIVGANLFSSWRDESPETWERNKELLSTFTNVAPIPAAAFNAITKEK